RARGLGADIRGPEARGGADAGARAARRHHGAAIQGPVARIAPGGIRVHAEAADWVVARWHRRGWASNPTGKLGHAGLGDDHGARIAQALYQRRLVGWPEAFEGERAAGRRHV